MLGSFNKDASLSDLNVSNQNELPTDTVSSISWIPDTNNRLFAASSWDSKIRIYETIVNSFSSKLGFKGAIEVEDPCLSVTWCEGDTSKIIGACINGYVKVIDANSGKHVNVGQHEHSVRSVYWVPKVNLILSLSFDKTMKFWDCKQDKPVATFSLSDKISCSDYLFPYLAIGMSDERLTFLDLNDLQSLQGKTLDSIESPLGKGSQITSIGFWSDAGGVGIGTHDGRVNVSKFAKNSFGKIKLETQINFKSKKYEGVPTNKQILYPVHDLGFHSMNKGFIFTSGGEGSMTTWDFYKKDRINFYDYQGVPVSRAKLSPDGLLMAYSLGYDWSLGIQGHMSCQPRICVHVMNEKDIILK